MRPSRFVGTDAQAVLADVRAQLGPDAVILANRQIDDGIEVIAMSGADLAAWTAGGSGGQNSEALASVAGEMQSLRSLLEGQLADLTFTDAERRNPVKATVWRNVMNLGFSPALVRKLLEHLPPQLDAGNAMRWARAALARNIAVGGEDIVERGGVFALVGPTGVGKTTTIAKLAARCLMKRGDASVALVTIDNYRIGAYEQLRVYADILNAPLFAVNDDAGLEAVLAELAGRHLVLVDTAGMNQHDQRLADQIGLLCHDGVEIDRILVLAAAAQGAALEEAVRGFGTRRLAGCILTKLDESVTIGAALDVLIRHRLPVLYLTTGQRVPEDLDRASVESLIERVFKAPGQSAFSLRDDEYGGAPQRTAR